MRVIKSSKPGKSHRFCPPGTVPLHGWFCLPATGWWPWEQHLETWAQGPAGHAELPGARFKPSRLRLRSLTVSEGLGASPRAKGSALTHLGLAFHHYVKRILDVWWVQVLTGLTHRRIRLNSNKSITRNQHQVENPDRSSTMLVTYSRLIQPSLICLT